MSTVKQAGVNTTSFEIQHQFLDGLAERNSWDVVESMRIAHSGADQDGPHLAAITKAVENGEVDIVSYYDPDRSFRDLLLALNCVERWYAYGVQLWIGGVHIDPENPDAMFAIQVQWAAAEHRRAKLRQTSLRKRPLVRKGVWYRKVPMGYDLTGDRRLRPNGKAAVVAAAFFSVAVLGFEPAYRIIGKRWNWSRRQFREFIQCEVYKGLSRWGGQVVHIEEYRLVSDEAWELANRAVIGNRKSAAKPPSDPKASKALIKVTETYGISAVMEALLAQTLFCCRTCYQETGILNPLRFDGVREGACGSVPYLRCSEKHSSIPALTRNDLEDVGNPLRICWQCGNSRKSRFSVERSEGGFRAHCKECNWSVATPIFPFATRTGPQLVPPSPASA